MHTILPNVHYALTYNPSLTHIHVYNQKNLIILDTPYTCHQPVLEFMKSLDAFCAVLEFRGTLSVSCDANVYSMLHH